MAQNVFMEVAWILNYLTCTSNYSKVVPYDTKYLYGSGLGFKLLCLYLKSSKDGTIQVYNASILCFLLRIIHWDLCIADFELVMIMWYFIYYESLSKIYVLQKSKKEFPMDVRSNFTFCIHYVVNLQKIYVPSMDFDGRKT